MEYGSSNYRTQLDIIIAFGSMAYIWHTQALVYMVHIES